MYWADGAGSDRAALDLAAGKVYWTDEQRAADDVLEAAMSGRIWPKNPT